MGSVDVWLVNVGVVVPSVEDAVVTVGTSGKVRLTVSMVVLGVDVVLLLSELLVGVLGGSTVQLLDGSVTGATVATTSGTAVVSTGSGVGTTAGTTVVSTGSGVGTTAGTTVVPTGSGVGTAVV